MFGKNPVRKQELTDGSELWVKEIFPTIQGEGPLAGSPAIFIRLGGCNLRCWFCDTDFEAAEVEEKTMMRVEAIVDALDALDVRTWLVVISGGEPFRQNILPLIDSLDAGGYVVQIETAGTLWLNGAEQFFDIGRAPANGGHSIVCSPKTSKLDPRIIPYISAFKYIVGSQDELDERDGMPIAATQGQKRRQRLARPPKALLGMSVYLQPMDEYDASKNADNHKRCVWACMKHGHKISLQLHKQLGLR